MKQRLTLLLVALMACTLAVSAQGRRGLRINEVMVQNESSVIDDFGNHNAWVELFNSTYAPLEISSVYMTNDSTNKKMYPVPLGDVNTEIPSRQHVLFWADGKPSRGTFHMNITLTPGQDNWIGVYDADGLTLIDEVVVPASLLPDQSYARVAEDQDGWEIRTGEGDLYITPSSNNLIKDTNYKVEMFAEKDANGFGLSILAMCIVFSALLMLSICFYIISRIGAKMSKERKTKATSDLLAETVKADGINVTDNDSGEVIAAIGMALYQHLNAHDLESDILTIRKTKRSYSPWSSKIYNMRQMPK